MRETTRYRPGDGETICSPRRWQFNGVIPCKRCKSAAHTAQQLSDISDGPADAADERHQSHWSNHLANASEAAHATPSFVAVGYFDFRHTKHLLGGYTVDMPPSNCRWQGGISFCRAISCFMNVCSYGHCIRHGSTTIQRTKKHATLLSLKTHLFGLYQTYLAPLRPFCDRGAAIRDH